MNKVMHYIPLFAGIVLLMSLSQVEGQTTKGSMTLLEQKVNTYKKCYLSTGDCNLKSLDTSTSTFIYPGGDTRCIAEDSEYRFEVSKGSNEFHETKVLLYFQGGGGCFSKSTSYVCEKNSKISSIDGVFDRKNVDNPYKDWTIIHVLYCSGDVHSGDKTLNYIADGNKKNSTNHFGLKNTNAVFNWMAEQHFKLEELVVMGCSAGSLGAQMHANTILTKFKPKNALFVLDSYVGIFPKAVAGELFSLFGSCETTLFDWNPSLKQKCRDKTISVPEVLEETIAKHSTVTFASLNSRIDTIQRSFATLVGYSLDNSNIFARLQYAESILFPNTFEEDLIETLSPLLTKYPNFKTYTVPGRQHCFTHLVELYNTVNGETGLEGIQKRPFAEKFRLKQPKTKSLVEWLKELGNFPS